MQSRQHTRNSSVRPKSSLSEHVAREIQRDYPSNTHRARRREPLKSSARGIKRFMFATAGSVKRVSVATGKRGAKVGGTLKRSATSLAKMAYNEWTYSEYSPNNSIACPRQTNNLDPYGYPVISSPVIVPGQPESPQLSPFFAYASQPGTPIDTPCPNVNPASSIEELLQAYGISPGHRLSQRRIPPPPARAIFPPGYTTVNRVHVRSRPGASRPFSRAGPSSRPVTQHMRVPSVLSSNPSRPPTRSDATSDVLGRTSLYLEVQRASPLRPQSENKRPETAKSTVPRLRSRNLMAEVVSCSTQTSPPPTVTTFDKEAESAGASVPKQATGFEDIEAAPSRARRRRKRSHGTRRSTSRLTPTLVATEIVVEEDSLKTTRQEGCRDQGTQNVNHREGPAISEHRVHSSSHSDIFNERSEGSGSSQGRRTRSTHANTGVSYISRASTGTNMMDIDNISEAMEQHYRAQTQSSSRIQTTGGNRPLSPMSSTLDSPQVRIEPRALTDSIRTMPRSSMTPRSSHYFPLEVRVEPPTPVYQIPAVIESFDKSPSEYNPNSSRSFRQSAPNYRCSEAVGQLRSEVHQPHSSEQTQRYRHSLVE